MLRLRDIKGNVMPLQGAYRFVEITDLDGKLARVLYQDENGIVHEVSPEDPEAVNYTRMFKTEWCDLIVLPEEVLEFQKQ